jgi:hypothetical protein
MLFWHQIFPISTDRSARAEASKLQTQGKKVTMREPCWCTFVLCLLCGKIGDAERDCASRMGRARGMNSLDLGCARSEAACPRSRSPDWHTCHRALIFHPRSKDETLFHFFHLSSQLLLSIVKTVVGAVKHVS